MTQSAGMMRRWRGPLLIGVFDQAAMSGANFALNIALARWLDPSSYGAFAVGWSVLLVLSGPHTAVLTDALAVVGPRRFPGDDLRYLRSLLIVNAALITLLGALVVAAGALSLFNTTVLSASSLALAIAAVLTIWLIRGACYLERRPLTALGGSVCYAVVMLGLIFAAHAGGWLSPLSALVIVGIAGIAGSAWMALALGLFSPPWAQVNVRQVIREHWAYGRWTLSASIAHGLGNGLYAPLLASVMGLPQTALLRAVQNMILPLQQAVTGMILVAYPSMSRSVAEEGPSYVVRRGPLFVAGGVLLTLIYGLVVSIFARPLLALVYGSGFYADRADVVWLAALAAVAATVAQLLGILVRVIERPQGVLLAKLAALVWFVVPGVMLVRSLGVTGALWSATASAAAESVALIGVLVWALRHRA